MVDKARKDLLLQRKIRGFGTLLYDCSKDCPICLEEFRDKDEIIQLDCTKRHIFHSYCLDQYLQSDLPRKECCICRE